MENNPNQQLNQQSLVQQQVVNEVPHSKSKNKLILLTIVLILMIGVGAYFLLNSNPKILSQYFQKPTPVIIATVTPTPNPMANWKTFTSAKYKYSLKYPDNMVATENLTPFYTVIFKNTNASPGEFPSFSLLASSDTFIAKSPAAYNYLSADIINSFMTMAPGEMKKMDTVIFTKLPDVVIAGMQATELKVTTTDDNTNQKRVIIKNGGNMYVFVNDSNDPNFDNFLSTFKFADQDQTSDDLTWKTYESGQVISGLSITYPKGWIVNYKKELNLSSDYTAKYRLTFDFAPSDWKSSNSTGWMGWGNMFFDVYDPQININQMINEIYPKDKDYLVGTEEVSIAGKPTFIIKSNEKKTNWPWLPRRAILGKNYSYTMGYSQNGESNFIETLKKEIFPQIHIE